MEEINKLSPNYSESFAVNPKDRHRQNAVTQSHFEFFSVSKWSDLLIAASVLVISFTISNLDRIPSSIDEFLALRVTVKNAILLGIFLTIYQRICHLCGLYDVKKISSLFGEFSRVVSAGTLGSVFVFVFYFTSVSGYFTFRVIVGFWLATIVMTLVTRQLWLHLFAYGQAISTKSTRVVIVGSGPRARKFTQELYAHPYARYEIIGFVDSNYDYATEAVKQRSLGHLDQLEDILMRQVVDEVLIALPIKSCYADIQNSIRVCEKAGIEAKYISDLFHFTNARALHQQSVKYPVMTMKVVQDDYRMLFKRFIDICGSAIGLLLLSPAMLLIAVAIKLTSKGPVFFSQERFGLNKRRFRMHKFRTMVPNAEVLQKELEAMNEASGPVFKIKNDPRVTAVGKFLRKTSLDETPQLWNVLRGEMSLVGPRPLPMRDVSRFTEAWLMRRFSVKPGLTCLWQVSGRSDIGFDRWVELDLQYIDKWSLSLDLVIMAKTFPAVIKGSGAA